MKLKARISPNFTIIFFFLLLLNVSQVSAMSTLYSTFFNNRYEIRDLIKNGTCFTTYANMWTASSKSQTNQISSCADGYSILGGMNMLGSNSASQSGEYFQRSYATLRTHNVIFFTFTFYALGSWDPNDYFQLNFDGTILNGFNTLYILKYYENPQCTGASSGLRNIKGFGNVLHSSTSLNFQFISRMDENNLNEAWGFREFNTFFVQMASPPANSLCVKGSDDTVTSLDCVCPEGFYGASCSACDPNCASCWGPSASQCFQCKPGSSLVGTACVACPPGCSFCSGTAYNTCVDCIPGWFLINGNQCIPRCDPPLLQGSDAYGCVATCSTPCTTTTDFIYWDGTCDAACPVPLTQGTLFGIPGLNTCNLPCDNGQYFFVDGSCSATCDAPRYSVNMNAQQYCIDPCPVGQYLCWNGTCLKECKFPLTQTPSHNQILCQYGCSSTQYLYWDGSCASSCPFPLSTRIENGYKFCDYPLDDTTQFLYYDGSSAVTCPAPLSTRIQGTIFVRKYCDYLCSSSQYLYANGTCGNYCNSPLTVTIKGGKQFCNNPCGADFLYWNGSCISTCNSPYFQRLEPGVKYCDYSCIAPLYYYWDGSCLPSCASPLKPYNEGTVNSRYCVYTCGTSEFLYWNETCSSSCSFPLVKQTYKSKQFCTYPCSDQQFLYYNGTCSDNCLEPFVERRENGYGFCEFPCSMSSEYMLWNYTCMGSCQSPLVIQLGPYGERYCNLPCASPFRFYVVETGQCLTECDTNSIIENELFPICSLEGPQDDSGIIEALLTADGKSGSYSLIAPVKLSSYVKYLKVQRSPRLSKFAASQARPILSLKFNIPLPSSFVKYFVYEGIPSDYFQNGVPQLHTSFMVNYWNNFSTLMVVLGAALLLMMINFGMKRSTLSENTKQTVERIKIIFKWNFCLLLIAINSDEIILYTYLDFKTMVLDKGSSTVSLIACLFFLGLLAGILITGFILVLRRQNLKNSALKLNDSKNYDDFLYSWDGWQIVFRGYQDQRFLSSLFYLIYIVRFFLPSITMIAFMDYPLTQSVLQGLITFGIIEAILLLNPIKNRASQIQLLVVETLTLMINASAFFLAVFDHTGYSGVRARILIGDIIILGNFLITMTMITFIVVKLGREIIEIMKARKAKKPIGSADWMRLLVILLQQYAFGFEEIFPRNQFNGTYQNINRDFAAADNKQDLHHMQQSERQGLSFTDFKKEGLNFGSAGDQLNSSRPLSLASTAAAHSPVKKRLERLREKRGIHANQNLAVEEEKDGDDVISDNVSVVSMNLSNVGLVGRAQSSSSIVMNEENPAAKKWQRRKLKKPEREPANTFSEINFDQGLEGANRTFGGRDLGYNEPFPERDRGSLMEDQSISGFSNRPRRINRSRSPDLEPSGDRGFKLVDSPRNEDVGSVNERRTSDFSSPSIERRMSPGRRNVKHRTQEMKSLFKLS